MFATVLEHFTSAKAWFEQKFNITYWLFSKNEVFDTAGNEWHHGWMAVKVSYRESAANNPELRK